MTPRVGYPSVTGSPNNSNSNSNNNNNNNNTNIANDNTTGTTGVNSANLNSVSSVNNSGSIGESGFGSGGVILPESARTGSSVSTNSSTVFLFPPVKSYHETGVKICASAPPCQSGASAPNSGESQSQPQQHLTAKRESYKDRRKNYIRQKKRAAEEIFSAINDPSVVVMADWVKVRGTFKGWAKLWCELKPGLLILYKSAKTYKSGQWVGTVLLNVCEVIERPSKKDGFCFKIFNPLEQSIWASKGPKGETFGAIMLPLPMAYLIFRAPSEQTGRNWMESMEISLRCSSLLLRSGQLSQSGTLTRESISLIHRNQSADEEGSPPSSAGLSSKMAPSEIEKHFEEHVDSLQKNDEQETSESDSDTLEKLGKNVRRGRMRSVCEEGSGKEGNIVETNYTLSEIPEEFGKTGDQTEEVGEENKSLLWTLLKQVRPGMDLSKVVLPTFILEPRSFLEKLTDYYYHCDIISKACLEDDPLMRMKMVIKWYLSGFYKKPKGLKKPYNPILGETFRCYWQHPSSETRTFFVAEQLSHHPPVSAFYVTNRKDGFCISGSILAKSKFYGNSVSALLDGTARLSLLTRGEDYTITMPYAHCKGILMGTISIELGGKVEIKCEKTGYYTEMEFKLKPLFGGSDLTNCIVGKIKLGKETLYTIDGHWDTEIYIKDKKTNIESLLWNSTPEIRASRLKRFIVPMDEQGEFESEKLWKKVSLAIAAGDQIVATQEKTVLEEAQRKGAKNRAESEEIWIPRYFVQDVITGEWVYKHADTRPWDTRTDVVQYERDFIIQTKTRHKTPTVSVRTNSVISIEGLQSGSMSHLGSPAIGTPNARNFFTNRSSFHQRSSLLSQESGESSSPERKLHISELTKSEESEKEHHGSTLRESRSFHRNSLNKLLYQHEDFKHETRNNLKILSTKVDQIIEQNNLIKKNLTGLNLLNKNPEVGVRSKFLSRLKFIKFNLTEIFTVVLIAILTQSVINFLWDKIRSR